MRSLADLEACYADGGEVDDDPPPRRSSSPASPGVAGAIKDAAAALKDFYIDSVGRKAAADHDAYINTIGGLNPPPTASNGPPPQGNARGGAIRGHHPLLLARFMHRHMGIDPADALHFAQKYHASTMPAKAGASEVSEPGAAVPSEES